MYSVNNNNYNISKTKLQVFLEQNYIKLGFSNEVKDKIIKNLRKRYVKKEMRNIFYKECLKKLEYENDDNKRIRHLTSTDRKIIELFFNIGFSQTLIADFIGKNRSTICREINSKKYQIDNINSTKSPFLHPDLKIDIYDSDKAQRISDVNKSKCKKKHIFEKHPKVLEIVTGLLRNGKDFDGVRYSPEAICALIKNGKVKGINITLSYGVIYNSVKQRMHGITINDLPHGRHYYKPKIKNSKAKSIPESKIGHSIDDMTEDLKDKTNPFLWEGDSVIGKRDGTNNTLITLVNNVSKFTLSERAKDKTAKSFVDVLDNIETKIPDFKKIMKNLLLDNGCEFSAISEIMRSKYDENEKRLMVYFAHAYASYERGLNENTNRLIRRDIIKGVNINNYSDEYILNVVRKLNNMPRKSLHWKTPLEKMEEILLQNKLDTKWLDEYRMPLCKYLIG